MINPLPNDEILNRSKLKALAVDKRNVTSKLKFVSERSENILGKGENAGYQHFLLFPKCFQLPSSMGSLTVGFCGKKLRESRHTQSVRDEFNPLLDDKILDSSKLKEFADDDFKFDEIGRKFSKLVENTVEKGEIAHYE